MNNAYKRKYDEMNKSTVNRGAQQGDIDRIQGNLANDRLHNQSNFPTDLYTPGENSYNMGYTSNPNNVSVPQGTTSYTNGGMGPGGVAPGTAAGVGSGAGIAGGQYTYDDDFKNAASELGGAQSKVFNTNNTTFANENPYAHPTSVAEEKSRRVKMTAENIQRRVRELDQELDEFLEEVFQLRAA